MSYIGNQPTSVAFPYDTFSGTGSQTAFTMQLAPANTASVMVFVSGVKQDPSTYSVSGTTLTFSAAPPSGSSNISAIYLGIPASGVVNTAYRTVTNFTATAGQTTFTPPSYTAGYIDVYRNGVKLALADFTATNGTTVVLANGATAGDVIETDSFYVSSVLNAIPAVAGAVNDTYLSTGAVTQAKLGTNVAGNGPLVSAYNSTTQSISSATWTKITLDSEEYDTNNNFASSRFTPTVAGYYQVNGCIRVDSNQNPLGSAVYKNGGIYRYSFQIVMTASSASLTIAPVNCIVYLNGSTDYIELYGYSSAGGTIVSPQNSVYLQAAMIRSA